jgi:hypothetical protein
MSVVLATIAAALFLSAVALIAYHNGRRHGRVMLPASLVDELRDHKLHCIGEPAERVALEIALLCDAADRVDLPLSR